MRFVYPFEAETEGESIVIEFPDVPGAVTQVDPGEDFNDVVRDCLIAALGGYVNTGRIPPEPSVSRGRHTVTLDVMTSAKLALALALSANHTSNVDLAKRLNVTEKVVRRLLDLDHASRIDRLEAALTAMGQQLELTVRSKRVRPLAPHQERTGNT